MSFHFSSINELTNEPIILNYQNDPNDQNQPNEPNDPTGNNDPDVFSLHPLWAPYVMHLALCAMP